MNNIIYLGKLGYKKKLEKVFGHILSEDVIITAERMAHIAENHPKDCELFSAFIPEALSDPDIIINDDKNKATVFMVKRLGTDNLNVIIRLVLETDNFFQKNSVITFYRIRNSNLAKLTKRNKVLYKKE